MQATVRIERYADQGRCVGHIDGQVIFVRFALPGELVEVNVDLPIRSKRRFLTGEVTKVLEASEYRVDPVWPIAGPLAWGGGVGGADLIHVSIEGQLVWKQSVIEEQMKRLGHIETPVPVLRAPGDVKRGGLHWRTRIDLIADEKGRASMRRRESHERVPLESMPLATAELNEMADHAGIWKGGIKPGTPIRLAMPAHQGHEPVDNFACILGEEIIAGRGKLTETVEVEGQEFNYTVDASGFWQIHRQAPTLLAGEVVRAVKNRLNSVHDPVVWDLYSGSGLFTLPLAKLISANTQILSVEGSPTAVMQAHHNVEFSGLSGKVTALQGDVGQVLSTRVPAKLARPDAVVLDPPRAGAKAEVCHLLAKLKTPIIVYVACDSSSLARDTATLCELGYQLSCIQAFDIYPMTHHVETLAVFTL